jgi:hypothetical protein
MYLLYHWIFVFYENVLLKLVVDVKIELSTHVSQQVLFMAVGDPIFDREVVFPLSIIVYNNFVIVIFVTSHFLVPVLKGLILHFKCLLLQWNLLLMAGILGCFLAWYDFVENFIRNTPFVRNCIARALLGIDSHTFQILPFLVFLVFSLDLVNKRTLACN